MIKVNSKVIIKSLFKKDEKAKEQTIKKLMSDLDLNFTDIDRTYYCPLIMIVEGLYYRDKKYGIKRRIRANKEIKPELASCVWYNTKNELQSAFINLELLTEL